MNDPLDIDVAGATTNNSRDNIREPFGKFRGRTSMLNHAIQLGDPRGLLQDGPSVLKDPSVWTQYDSDILAHLLQVHSQIRRSSWYAAPKHFTEQGGKTLNAEMPSIEQFVYAVGYFRQCTLKKDSLLKDAADRYCSHTACPTRQFWIQHEVTQFNTVLDAPPWPISVGQITLRQLIDAFLYSAGLFHKFREPGHQDRINFLALYDNVPRGKLLYALNGGLLALLNHVGHVAVVVQQDLGHWLNVHSLPLPDVRWHDRLFDVPAAG